MSNNEEIDYARLRPIEKLSSTILKYIGIEDIADLAKRGRLTHWKLASPDGSFVSESLLFDQEILKAEINGFLVRTDAPMIVQIEKHNTPLNLPKQLAPMGGAVFEYTTIFPSVVYFLVRRDEIVYIGKSVAMPARIGTHKSNSEKEFDRVLYILVPEEQLSVVELSLIKHFKPEYNVEWKRKGNSETYYEGVAKKVISGDDIIDDDNVIRSIEIDHSTRASETSVKLDRLAGKGLED